MIIVPDFTREKPKHGTIQGETPGRILIFMSQGFPCLLQNYFFLNQCPLLFLEVMPERLLRIEYQWLFLSPGDDMCVG